MQMSFDPNSPEYAKKLHREQQFYKRQREQSTFLKRFLNHPLIYSEQRLNVAYDLAKIAMSKAVQERLNNRKVDRLLIAPCGTGSDFPYLVNLAHEIYGLDISEEAVASCPAGLQCRVADVLASGYPDGMFDLIVSPLFFHHLRQIGFEPFLREFSRLLQQGGVVAILEPSLWYPLNLVTRPLKMLGNPYGEIEEEGPIPPAEMIQALKTTGYYKISWHGATFAHSALPVFASKILHRFMWPFRRSILKSFFWMNVFVAEKPTS
jgi:SAM-dependent methyltransferase